MRGVIAVAGALAMIGAGWVWLSPSRVEATVLPRICSGAVPLALDAGSRLAGFMIVVMPLAALLYLLYQAYALFDAFRRGHVLTDHVPVRLRRIGMSMIALAVIRPVSAMLLGLALTAPNAPGQRVLAIFVGIDDYLLAAFGGLMLAIGYAMAEAARIADDHRQII
jgi:hypothetical protein